MSFLISVFFAALGIGAVLMTLAYVAAFIADMRGIHDNRLEIKESSLRKSKSGGRIFK